MFMTCIDTRTLRLLALALAAAGTLLIALPAWAHVVPPLLEGFPPRPFSSDAQLEWRNIEPWSGLLGTPDCASQPVPFLPGTAPKSYCVPSLPLGPESPDSLAAEDSTAVEPP